LSNPDKKQFNPSINMKRITPLFLLLAALCIGCAHVSNKSSADNRYERLANDFVTGQFAFDPLTGVALGWHQYDGRYVVPDQQALAAEDNRLKRFESEFAALPANQLTPVHRHDLQLLQSTIANERWAIEVQRVYWLNPMSYAGNGLTIYLKRDFKPLAARVADITAIIRQTPAVFAAARSNLQPVLPRPFVETAIEVANGNADFLENDVSKAAATVNDPAIRARFEEAKKIAVAEFRGYADWLNKEKLPTADTSFAVGRDAYIAMLKSEYIDLTPEQILEIGLRKFHAEQQRFAEAARVIDPTHSPIEVYKAIQREHPTAANLIPDTRKELDGIRQFIIEHHIVTIPSELRPRVEETPPPLRATSFASMDTPGPFEEKATEAYYYVTPVEPDWTTKQAEEWLTAFNYYELAVTSIHEAYPGHYVQFLALNASHATTVEKVFGSYAYIEGWAHYCEQMLIDQGYAQPPNPVTASHDELVKAAKYRLAQSDEALLRLCRLCCSIKLHCQGMTVDEATRFFMDNCYYEEKPAHSEAVRGTFDPGYLYYTLGKLMILKLRSDWQAQEGANYTLQKFHDEFLRHGMPPIPLLRKIMLKDPKQWPKVL
jgi:uncharacterized protein (DUF885 family)